MSHKTVRFLANQRLDLPDLRSISEYTSYEWQTFGEHILAGGSPYILRGMVCTHGGALVVNVTVDDLVLITPDGKYNRWRSTEPQLTIGVTASSTSYVEAQIYTETSKSETRVFWDASAGSGAGEEFTATLDTANCQKIRLVSNTTGFSGDSDKVPVCVAIAPAGVITKLQDNYSFVLGAAPAIFPENKLFKLNDADLDGVQDRFAFGSPRTDDDIDTIRDLFQAFATEFADIKGDGATTAAGSANDWHMQRPTDLFASNQDRNAILSQGGTFTWSTVTNNLTFSADIIIRIPGIAGTNTIQAAESPVSMPAAGNCAYVSLDRDAAGAANLSVTVAAFAAVPTDKDVFVFAIRGTDNRVYLSDGTSMGTGDSTLLGNVDLGVLVPVGSIIPFYDFNAAVTFDANFWIYCDGAVVADAGSPINGETLPDLSNRYLVGFGTEGGGDIDTAAWATAVVGNASHQIDVSHIHTMGTHIHTMGTHRHTLSHTHTITGNTGWIGYWTGGAGTAPNIPTLAVSDGSADFAENFNLDGGANPEGQHIHNQSHTSNGASTSNTSYVDPGDTNPIDPGDTNPSLSATQTIQPRSIRVRFIMRKK